MQRQQQGQRGTSVAGSTWALSGLWRHSHRAHPPPGAGPEARAPSQACGVTPTVHILRWGQGRPTAGSRSRLPRNTLGVPRVIPKEEKLILSEVTWNLDIKIFQRTHMNLNLVSCGITYQSVEEAP